MSDPTAASVTASVPDPATEPTGISAGPQLIPAMASSTRLWIWGLPLVFLIHDGEEVLDVYRQHGLFSGTRLIVTPTQFLTAVLFEFAVGWAVAVAAVWSGRPGWAMRLQALALAGFTLHGIGHLLMGAVVTDGDAFGAVTALPACVVFGGLALVRLRAAGLLNRREMICAWAAAPVAVMVLIGLALGFGRLVA